VTRLIDRLLSRADGGYHESMYSGAYPVTVSDPSGRGKESVPAGVVSTARDAFTSNGVVYSCIAARQSLFAEARFTLQSTVDKHLYGNTGLRLLEYPAPGQTAGELLARLEQDVSLAGNSYWRKTVPADGSDPLLVQMRPDTVIIVSEEKHDEAGRVYKEPVGYLEDLSLLGITDRDPQFYGTDEVAHYSPVPDPKALWRGMSWLTPVLREIGSDQAMVAYKTRYLQNGAVPGLVIKYSQKLQPGTIDMLRERTSARYAGPDNAGRTLVLDNGADVVVAGANLEQLQYTAVQGAGAERVASAAQVPLEVVGLGSWRAGGGDYLSAMRRFADLWARPHWRMACAALQHLVTITSPATGEQTPVTPPARLWFDVADIAALREGELERGQAVLVRAQAVSTFVAAGYTRESAVAASDSGDLSQLKADPAAPAGQVNTRQPQAGRPEALPGVVRPNLPNAQPREFVPMPGMPNGARG
jgi:phage portal protein BeeE